MSETNGSGPQPVQADQAQDERAQVLEEFANTMSPEQWTRFELILEEQRRRRVPKEVSPAERVLADPPDQKVHGLTIDQILAALEAAVMVVRPGEVLVVRVPPWLHPEEIARYQRAINELLWWHGLHELHVLVLPGEEFAKLRPGPETLQALIGRVRLLPPEPVSDLVPTMASPVEPEGTGPQSVWAHDADEATVQDVQYRADPDVR